MAFKSKEICDKCEAIIDRINNKQIIEVLFDSIEFEVIFSKISSKTKKIDETLVFCDKECATDYFRNLIDAL
jgi:hypothetical protein